MSDLMKCLVCVLCATVLGGCATQRYGRMIPVSGVESSDLTCEQINAEISQVYAFKEDVVQHSSQFTASDVFGFLGDFGIGNAMEKSSAIDSANKRFNELQGLKSAKQCN